MVTCPAGKQSISWLPNTWPENGMMFEARFARKDCTPCTLRSRCTRAKNEPRIIGLQAREHYEALQSARRTQTTKEFQQNYAPRAGIEGTHAQVISRCGLRRCRYIGLAKTNLQHVITAAAVNLIRIADWHSDVPTAKTLRRPEKRRLIRTPNSPPVSIWRVPAQEASGLDLADLILDGLAEGADAAVCERAPCACLSECAVQNMHPVR